MDKPDENKPPVEGQTQPQLQKQTIWGEIVKGWYWVVFSWKMLQRMGGFRAIARSLATTLGILLKRSKDNK
ncbi:hypothetical protein [Pseudanabaena sp. PCC 6802]|uniref:hypothetical protein n=1 Tax=Pseudanabaena sp. PCC 6802 TaxID=118173 RepID=UPI000344C20E|nr:hypothetical protein [Pseudanabaena sp. PCC 6802]